ncbi:MAG: NAD(+) synthase [Firmicutes bacterium]|jgi:NAD+ synthase|nr:NAD(+) synthase [Bacillota bacterium]
MDAGRVAEAISNWLRGKVEQAGCRGMVFGLSGGLDSAVVGALCKRAMPDGCLGLIMPCHSDPSDVRDAIAVANAFNLTVETVDLGKVYDEHLANLSAHLASAGLSSDDAQRRLAEANLKPRLRMTTLYYFANSLKYVVVGTGNRSELTVGYFTKYGDGGVDLLPIGGLVKTQVRQLAQHLGVPEVVIEKAPSAGLWAGQTDEGEMGVTYPELDRYILTGEASGEVRKRVDRMHRAAEHKLRLPEIPELPLS